MTVTQQLPGLLIGMAVGALGTLLFLRDRWLGRRERRADLAAPSREAADPATALELTCRIDALPDHDEPGDPGSGDYMALELGGPDRPHAGERAGAQARQRYGESLVETELDLPANPHEPAHEEGAAVVPLRPKRNLPDPGITGSNDTSSPSTLAWLRAASGVDGDFLLDKVVNVVGRSSQCDVALDDVDVTVSRRHCVIRNADFRWWLIVEDTVHGTWINGRPAVPGTSQSLNSGDVIRLGPLVELEIFIPSSVPAASPPSETVEIVARRPLGPDLRFRSAAVTAIGGRASNQDAHYTSARVVAVADGVGGRPAGELAARLAVRGVIEADAKPDLQAVIQRINREVRDAARADPARAGMSSTLDLLVLCDDPQGPEVRGAHIGDGIVLAQSGARPQQLTQEHTLATELVKTGQMSARQSRSLPERGTLLRAVGLAEEITADFWQRPAVPGDRYLLASDGLLNALGMDGLQSALRALRAIGPDVCAHELVDAALRARASDNVTVVVADVVTDRDAAESDRGR